MAPTVRTPGQSPAGPRRWWLLMLALVAVRGDSGNPTLASRPGSDATDHAGGLDPAGDRFALADADWQRLRASIGPVPASVEQGGAEALSAEVDRLLRSHPGLDSGRIPACSAALVVDLRRSSYLDSRIAALDAALVEAAAEETRARALGEYITYEDRSQRVEERDIVYRMSEVLEGDRDQAHRELHRSHRINEAADDNVGVEMIERQEERGLTYQARLESLGAQAEALDGMAPAALAGFRATRSLAAYHEQRRAMLGARRDAMAAERDASRAWAEAEAHRLRSALAAIIQGEHPDTGSVADWPRSCPGLQEDSARILLSWPLDAGRDEEVDCPPYPGPGLADAYLQASRRALGFEATAAHRELEATREALAADLAAIDFEEDALRAVLLFDDYIIGRIEAHLDRLDARARLTEAQLRYAERRLARAALVVTRRAAELQQAERDSRAVDHLEHASQRSWSDQATLKRLLVAMQSIRQADAESQPALDQYRDAVEGSVALAGEIVDASPLGRWRPSLGSSAGLPGAEEQVRSAREALDRLVDEGLDPFDSPRARVSDRLALTLGATDPTDLGRIVPLRSPRRYSHNDPGPVQIRGPEEILRTALELKGEELKEWRREASELADE